MAEEKRILDANATSIGRQNWEVCTRILGHDLINIAATNKEVKDLLNFYHITFHESGGFTMALPRLKVIERKKPKKK